MVELKERQVDRINYNRPTLQLDGKSYRFSTIQLLNLIISGPILAILIYFFLKLRINYWVYEITAKQVVFILNFIFNINSTVIIDPSHRIYPIIYMPNHPFNENYAITTNCFAAHIFSILIGIILFIPNSKDNLNKKDFIVRKIEALTIAVFSIHILNILRIAFLLFFNFNGVSFEFIHSSLFFLSAIIGSWVFFILIKKWLPELFISIYYAYFLISQKKRTKKVRVQTS
ncbi:MAG: hypothetical protein ACFFCI_18880 [Promethearchaeota archaeon]